MGKMDSIKYVEFLSILPFKDLFSKFQQDNAPCHTCKLVKSFINEQQIDLLEWSANSPDVSPIENVRVILKGKVVKMQPSSLDDLVYCHQQK